MEAHTGYCVSNYFQPLLVIMSVIVSCLLNTPHMNTEVFTSTFSLIFFTDLVVLLFYSLLIMHTKKGHKH